MGTKRRREKGNIYIYIKLPFLDFQLDSSSPLSFILLFSFSVFCLTSLSALHQPTVVTVFYLLFAARGSQSGWWWLSLRRGGEYSLPPSKLILPPPLTTASTPLQWGEYNAEEKEKEPHFVAGRTCTTFYRSPFFPFYFLHWSNITTTTSHSTTSLVPLVGSATLLSSLCLISSSGV